LPPLLYFHLDIEEEIMHNRSEMVAVLGPLEALPYYIHTYIEDEIKEHQKIERAFRTG
jgi:hypothetical protein